LATLDRTRIVKRRRSWAGNFSAPVGTDAKTNYTSTTDNRTTLLVSNLVIPNHFSHQGSCCSAQGAAFNCKSINRQNLFFERQIGFAGYLLCKRISFNFCAESSFVHFNFLQNLHLSELLGLNRGSEYKKKPHDLFLNLIFSIAFLHLTNC